MAQDNLRAVILTALPVEFEAVREFLPGSKIDRHPAGNIYERGTFKANGRTWDVGIAEVGMGNSGAALETERAISHFNPQVIFFVGIAGGIKDVDIGDVVASTKIYGYASGKAKETFEPRPELGLSSYALIQQAKAEARSREKGWLNRLLSQAETMPKVKVGAIAAGEKVIASKKSDIYKFLKAQYGDALAVEMEGYGFLKAAHANEHRASAIVVRGISDLIDNKNDAANQPPENERQVTASLNASAFAFQLLANFEPNVRFMGNQAPVPRVGSPTWDNLFSYFQDADVSIIAPLCQEVFEEALTPEQQDLYPELNQLDSLQKLRTVFERRDEQVLAVSWVGRVINKFQNPDEGADVRSVPPSLQAWYNTRKPSQQEDAEPVKKSPTPNYLLIALEPKDDEDTVGFTAELHSADGTVLDTNLLPPGAKCSIEEPYEDLSKHLTEAVRKATQVKTIEFFLSWRHFDQPVHEWKASTGFGRPKQLKSFRSTLVRSLDRLTQDDFVDELLGNLDAQLTRLQECCDLDFAKYCHDVMALDWDTLEGDLPVGTEYLIFKLLSALPEDEGDLQELLSIVLWSGIPIWFWSYHPPSDTKQLSKIINDLLTTNNLQDSATFAEVIRKERPSLSNLGLLCDCPTRLPILVDWKNGRLRQPAA